MEKALDVSIPDFLNFAADVLGASTGLSLETAFGSIPEWDSVMHLRLVMEFEAAYGLSVPIEAVPKIRTLGDLYARIPR